MQENNNARVKAAGLYKYVYRNTVIYVGMSKNDVFARIDAHSKEEKFGPYLKECKIYVCLMTDCENSNLIKGYETVLIDQFRPILNGSEKPLKSCGLDFERMLNLNFQPLEKAKIEYCQIRRMAEDNDASKNNRMISKIEKSILKIERVVEKNERAFRSFLALMKELNAGNYTIIERDGKDYKELKLTDMFDTGAGGIDKETFRYDHLDGIFFEIRRNEAKDSEIYCIIDGSFPRNESLTQFLENICISRKYLFELRDKKMEILSNVNY